MDSASMFCCSGPMHSRLFMQRPRFITCRTVQQFNDSVHVAWGHRCAGVFSRELERPGHIFWEKKKSSPLQEGSDWQRDVHSCFTYTWLAVETRMKIAQYTCKYAFEYAFVYSSWALSRNHGDVWSCDRPIWISRRCFVLCLGFWPPSFPALPVFRLLVSFVSLCLRGFVAVFVLCLFGDLSRSRREICSFMIVELALS